MGTSSSLASNASIFSHLFALFPRHWLRQGKFLGPCQLWLTLMFMSVQGSKGYGRALAEMKRTLGRHFAWGDDRPSSAALSQARKKLTRCVCDQALRQVRDHCVTPRLHPGLRFANRRLVVCDGTNLTLPVQRALREHYGVPRSSHGDCLAPQAALTVLYDVGANQPLAFSLERCRYAERRALLDLEEHLQPGDLLIADRGYPSRALCARLCEKGRDFLFRASAVHANSLGECRDFLLSGKQEQTISLRLITTAQRAEAAGSPNVTVRLIRFRESVLITSLTRAEASAADLRRLYLNRWKIETAFAEMKGFRGLEDFHARTPDGIYQEVTAVFLFMLLASELEGRAHQAHATEIALTTTVSSSARHQVTTIRFNRMLLGDWVVYLLIDATKGARVLSHTFNEAMKDLWRTRMRYRPNRSFPRETKAPYGKWRLRPRITGKKGP
jgi:hypothetical protein